MGRNPATGARAEIPAKQVVKARIAKQVQGRDRSVDAVMPHAFIPKWRALALKERSASQEHSIDLSSSGARSRTPAATAGPTSGRRHHFAWEYKGPGADLDAPFDQVRKHSAGAGEPAPADRLRQWCDSGSAPTWTNSVSRTHEFELDDSADASTRDRLKWAFSDPDRLRPGKTRQSLADRVAAPFASVAQALRERGHEPQAVGDLVDVMATVGRAGFETVDWFNGGFSDNSTALPLEKSDIETVLAATDLDWSEIDPSILGTLFERGLDPGKRA